MVSVNIFDARLNVKCSQNRTMYVEWGKSLLARR